MSKESENAWAREYLRRKHYRELKMPIFKQGDKVRLKDSPYEGVVTSMIAGQITFKVTNSEISFGMTVSDGTVLEHVFDPQVGDVYRDINGREWAVREGNPVFDGAPYVMAMLIDLKPKDRPGYPYTQMILNNPEKRNDWANRYKPVLVRRRDQ